MRRVDAMSLMRRQTDDPRDLGLAAIDEQLDARDIARVVRREKGHRLGGLVARTGAAPRRDTGSVCFERIDLLVVHAELGLVARSYDRFLCVHAYTNSRRESHCPDHLATNQIVVTLDARKDTAVFFGSRNRIHADAR